MRIFCLVVCVVFIFAYGAIAAVDPLVQQQQSENDKWRMEAEKAAIDLSQQANKAFAAKDYPKAKALYQKVAGITYDQWDIRTVTSGDQTTPKPAALKIKVKLAGSSVAYANGRIRMIDKSVADAKEEQARNSLPAMLVKADAAAAKSNYAGYLAYDDVLATAKKMGQKKEAQDATKKAQAGQKKIVDKVALPIVEAEKLLAAGKADEALKKLRDMSSANAPFFTLVPELKDRRNALEKSPFIKKATRDKVSREQIDLGDAALARKEYLDAANCYREAANFDPDSQNGTEASQKLSKLEADPEIVKMMKQQEAENSARTLVQHAEIMLSLDKADMARADCAELLEKFPDSASAARAREIMASLDKPADSAESKE